MRKSTKRRSTKHPLLDFVMPDGKRLRQCSEPEIDVMKRFINDEATFGDLHSAGPSTAALAFVLAREVIMGVELAKKMEQANNG